MKTCKRSLGAVLLFSAVVRVSCFAQNSCVSGSITNAYCQPHILHPTNNGGWAILKRLGDQSNTEQQCYSPGGVTERNGFLTEMAMQNSSTCGDLDNGTKTLPYSSAMIQWNTFNLTGGDIIIRAKIAGGEAHGTWPAIWFLGSNCQASNQVTADNATYGGKTCNWHSAGSEEIDLAEFLNNSVSPDGNAFLSDATPSCSYSVSDASQNWHTYELRWVAGSSYQMWVDGSSTSCTRTNSDVPSTPMFLMINIATEYGSTNAGFPAVTTVDYVKACSSTCNGRNTVFFDNFVEPMPSTMLRPLSRMARLAGGAIAPGSAIVVNGQIQLRGVTVIQ